MPTTKTIKVSHRLGGITAGYCFSGGHYDPSKPTCVFVNSMCTTTALYQAQFENKKLTGNMNLLAVEPLGHGATSCGRENFTYWDSAGMILEVMSQLGVENAFAMGTSQGGWIVARMALLAPERILGLLLLGTSMDYESSASRLKGCWEPRPALLPFLEKWTSKTPTPEFVVDDIWCGMVGGLGFGSKVTEETTEFWMKTLKEVYRGDEGRSKARMAVICLLERDGLLLRLGDVGCPVYWLHGSEDVVYSIEAASEQVKLFTSSKEVKFSVVEGGVHYLNATSPTEVGEALLEIVSKYK